MHSSLFKLSVDKMLSVPRSALPSIFPFVFFDLFKLSSFSSPKGERDFQILSRILKGLLHPACLARVVSWFAFVVAIFMGHENGGKQKPTKRRHVQGMLDETDPLKQFKT